MRPYFSVCAKRAVETLKVVDDGEDAFEMTQNTGSATLSFGVGYGEVGEDHVEKGTGALSGFQEDVVWGIMLQKDVDDSMFRELDSLARVA
jgi:SWI/SNF chromatin-remodeling complex subunit SWI1